MKTCVLDSVTKRVENCIMLSEQEKSQWIAPRPGLELAPRHDGEIGWTWDTDTQNWIQPAVPEKTQEQLAVQGRQLRDKYLHQHVDTINAVRWQSLSDQQRQEIMDYRQALLDVPAQTGWPRTVTWPQLPDWLD